MKSENFDIITESFTRQSENFQAGKLSFSKKEYLDFTVSCVKPSENDTVLEVAAGTCACGRAFSPFVHQLICLDMTSAMLSVGKTEAERQKLNNMIFVLGDAREMPFLENSFDIVISRLAFHHFPDTKGPFEEMLRVLKPGGKLVLIDMEAAEEELRNIRDKIETLRDPSHIRNLSKNEMLNLFAGNSVSVEMCELTSIPTDLNEWMDFTNTPKSVQEQIVKRFVSELKGGDKTGFYPYRRNNGISFDQHWLLLIGKKR